MDFIPKPKKSAVYGAKASDADDLLERPQDPLVASVMEEDQARKKQKKGPPVTGGDTLTRLRACVTKLHHF